MPIETQTCTACRSPLPDRAAFCPACGAATPVGVDRATGEIVRPDAAPDGATGEQAQRLQRALGPGYELRQLLGRGGFSEVYAAWDARLKRTVAVKTFRGDLVVSETLLARFQREAEAVAKLRHPHVVPIYAVGEDHGLAYYTMPLLEGESLAAALDRAGAFDVAEACRILREASGALAAAHRVGIVHRDVKPDNILLEGPERSVVVMDFGIAKVADAGHGLTGTGMLVGTPHYMSPEQATGDRDLDPRSDQYSLAVLGYRMLTGHLPFEANSLQALLMKQITEVPQPVHEVRPDVPVEVSEALSRALSKDPTKRFPTIGEFAAALGAVGRPTGESGPSTRRPVPDLGTRAREAQATIARWRVPALIAGVIGLAAFAALRDGTTAPPVRVMAARRDDASYAAKTFLASRGVRGQPADYLDFESDDRLFRFLQESLGKDSALAWATQDASVWRWSLRRYDRARREVWTADVSARGEVVGFAHQVPDTSPGARLEPDAARRLAERELERAGLKLSELHLVQDTRQGLASRTDYTFAWDRAASSIPFRGDTARDRVTVGLTGDRVSSFQRRTIAPHSFERKSPMRLALVLIAGTVMCGAVLAAGIVASRRARAGSLQWEAARRLAAATGAIALVVAAVVFFYPMTVPEEPVAPSPGELIGVGVGVVMMLAVATAAASVALLAGEALAQEHRPETVTGIGDIARGRLATPELATAALAGYAGGALLAGLSVTVAWLGSRFLGRPISAGAIDAFEWVWPSITVLASASAALFIVPALFYGSMLARRWRLPPLAACALPAAVGALAASGEKPALDALITFIELLVPTLLAWRFGLGAGVLCMFVSDALPAVSALLRSGTSDFVTAGLVSVVLLALPAVFGVVSFRRLRPLARAVSPRVSTPATG